VLIRPADMAEALQEMLGEAAAPPEKQ